MSRFPLIATLLVALFLIPKGLEAKSTGPDWTRGGKKSHIQGHISAVGQAVMMNRQMMSMARRKAQVDGRRQLSQLKQNAMGDLLSAWGKKCKSISADLPFAFEHMAKGMKNPKGQGLLIGAKTIQYHTDFQGKQVYCLLAKSHDKFIKEVKEIGSILIKTLTPSMKLTQSQIGEIWKHWKTTVQEWKNKWNKHAPWKFDGGRLVETGNAPSSLNRTDPPGKTTPPTSSRTKSLELRVQELEKKIEKLMKRIEELERSRRGTPPSTPGKTPEIQPGDPKHPGGVGRPRVPRRIDKAPPTYKGPSKGGNPIATGWWNQSGKITLYNHAAAAVGSAPAFRGRSMAMRQAQSDGRRELAGQYQTLTQKIFTQCGKELGGFLKNSHSPTPPNSGGVTMIGVRTITIKVSGSQVYALMAVPNSKFYQQVEMAFLGQTVPHLKSQYAKGEFETKLKKVLAKIQKERNEKAEWRFKVTKGSSGLVRRKKK